MESFILCIYQETSWLQTFAEKFLLPVLVAIAIYWFVSKRDELKKKRAQSRLGVAILETLIEEVENGLKVLQKAKIANRNEVFLDSLPRKSWDGMSTIPDDILLRIIEVSKDAKAIGFHPKQIRTHCKNYFDHICPNWDAIGESGDSWKFLGGAYLDAGKFDEAAKGVLDMLIQAKDLLLENSKNNFPK